MYEINERFRIVYKESGLSQEKFADKIKRSRGEVANIIYDKTVPKDKIIEATCEAFDIQEDWLRYGFEPMRAEKTQEQVVAQMVGSALSGDANFIQAVVKMICSRTPDELQILEKALQDVYENIKKEDRQD